MKIQEVVLKEELSDKELLVSSKVGVVKNAKDTARIIHLLGEVAPLDMFGVSLFVFLVVFLFCFVL